MGFALGSYERTKPLVIDPSLAYTTYLGGSNKDRGQGIAVDSNGNAYVTGESLPVNFPITNTLTNPNQSGNAGSWDVTVTKINPGGDALVYSTYIGGEGDDGGYGIAVDAAGSVYVGGQSMSDNFPVVNAYQSMHRGQMDLFMLKLNSAGAVVLYSTLLGGTDGENGGSLAIDDAGNAYLGGWSRSSNFPVTGSYQAVKGGGVLIAQATFGRSAHSPPKARVPLSARVRVVQALIATQTTRVVQVSQQTRHWPRRCRGLPRPRRQACRCTCTTTTWPTSLATSS